MDYSLYITFLIVSFGIIVIPGPNVLVIVSTSLAHGKTRGLQTVAGTSLAMAVQLIIAALTTATFIHSLSQGFVVLKWVGVIYLLYLGITHLRQALQPQSKHVEISASATFYRGFFVSITNPKTILFFAAFLPQFVVSIEHYLQQITMLSLTFWIMAVILDSCYALASTVISARLKQDRNFKPQKILSGLLYICAGLLLATVRRT